MGFEVFTAVTIMMFFFRVLALCRLVSGSEKITVSIFRAEDRDSMFLRNVDIYRRVCTAPKPRRRTSSK
jgi:hypothetical protein